MRYLFITLVLSSICPSVSAEIYRWKDDAGNIVFSDTPRPGAEIVEISEPTIVPAGPTDIGPRPGPDGGALPYESVTIESPGSEETIRENVANVAVAVASEPLLQTAYGHKLQLFLDGQPFGPPGTSTGYTLPNVDRGSHTLEVAVLAPDGRELKRSAATTFFVHKHSIINRAK
jgi:hypothetical protein